MICGVYRHNDLVEELCRGESVTLPGCQLVKLFGDDRKAWLQGQTTNDLSQLAVGESVAACIVKPTGQLLTKLAITNLENHLLISIDKPEVLIERVAQFVILEDVHIEVVATSVVTGITSESGVKSWRVGNESMDFAGNSETGSWDNYLARSLETGWPIPTVDASEKTLPPELGQNFELSHIHYAKGCYVGQEVLQRIHSRGHVNKCWRVLTTVEPVDKSEPVHSLDGKRLGSIIRCSKTKEDKWMACAFLSDAGPGNEVIINNKSSVVRF